MLQVGGKVFELNPTDRSPEKPEALGLTVESWCFSLQLGLVGRHHDPSILIDEKGESERLETGWERDKNR